MDDSSIFSEIDVDKEPYVKKLSDDMVINLTGESGAGKSSYAKQFFDDDNYIVVDTDEIFSAERFPYSKGINKELGAMFRAKYSKLPQAAENFEVVYLDILDYLNDCGKTVVIDSAQFRNIKDIHVLKGTLVVLRTSIDTCFRRCLERYRSNYPNASVEDLFAYAQRKRHIYDWHLLLNDFLGGVDRL